MPTRGLLGVTSHRSIKRKPTMATPPLSNAFGTFTIKILTAVETAHSQRMLKRSTLLSRPAMYADCASIKQAWIDANRQLASHADIEYDFAARIEI